jgi:hypothetical protein
LRSGNAGRPAALTSGAIGGGRGGRGKAVPPRSGAAVNVVGGCAPTRRTRRPGRGPPLRRDLGGSGNDLQELELEHLSLFQESSCGVETDGGKETLRASIVSRTAGTAN